METKVVAASTERVERLHLRVAWLCGNPARRARRVRAWCCFSKATIFRRWATQFHRSLMRGACPRSRSPKP